jgi:hypothetical protein
VRDQAEALCFEGDRPAAAERVEALASHRACPLGRSRCKRRSSGSQAFWTGPQTAAGPASSTRRAENEAFRSDPWAQWGCVAGRIGQRQRGRKVDAERPETPAPSHAAKPGRALRYETQLAQH